MRFSSIALSTTLALSALVGAIAPSASANTGSPNPTPANAEITNPTEHGGKNGDFRETTCLGPIRSSGSAKADEVQCQDQWQTATQNLSAEQKTQLNSYIKAGDQANAQKMLSTLKVDNAQQLTSWAISNPSIATGATTQDLKLSDIGSDKSTKITQTTIDSRVDATRPIDAISVGQAGMISFDVPVLQCRNGELKQVSSTRMSVPAKSRGGSLSVGIPFVFSIGGSLSTNGIINGEAENVSALGRKLTSLTHALAWANMNPENPTVLLGLEFQARIVRNANEENDPFIVKYLEAVKKASKLCGNIPFNPPVEEKPEYQNGCFSTLTPLGRTYFMLSYLKGKKPLGEVDMNQCKTDPKVPQLG